jgi:hypothetical protein
VVELQIPVPEITGVATPTSALATVMNKCRMGCMQQHRRLKHRCEIVVSWLVLPSAWSGHMQSMRCYNGGTLGCHGQVTPSGLPNVQVGRHTPKLPHHTMSLVYCTVHKAIDR